MATVTLLKTTGNLLLLVQWLSIKLSLSPLFQENQVSGSHVHAWLVYVAVLLVKIHWDSSFDFACFWLKVREDVHNMWTMNQRCNCSFFVVIQIKNKAYMLSSCFSFFPSRLVLSVLYRIWYLYQEPKSRDLKTHSRAVTFAPPPLPSAWIFL